MRALARGAACGAFVVTGRMPNSLEVSGRLLDLLSRESEVGCIAGRWRVVICGLGVVVCGFRLGAIHQGRMPQARECDGTIARTEVWGHDGVV